MGMDPYVHVCIFHKAIQANGEKNDADIINIFCLHFVMPYSSEEIILWKPIQFANLKSWRLCFVSVIRKYKLMNKGTWHYEWWSKVEEKVEVYYEHILKLANCI
jgi:hypothetical protein